MPSPTLSSAHHLPVWERVIAWLARANAFFGDSALASVKALTCAFLAADPAAGSKLFVELYEIEQVVRRLLIAAALALRLEPPADAAPAFDTLLPSARDAASFDSSDADDDDNWPPGRRAQAAALHWIEADALYFAKHYLALRRLLADPDKAIRELARRFARNPRQALEDVTAWIEDARTRSPITHLVAEAEATALLVPNALCAFRIHVEPG